MKKCTLFIVYMLAGFAAFASQNLIKNADLKNGLLDFGFSDSAPETLGVKIEKFSDSANSLSYSAGESCLGGLNLSEVRVSRDGVYEISFSAKASHPLQIRLLALANGNTVYRHQLAKFDVGTEWKKYSYKLDMKRFRVLDEWLPLRFEKVSKAAARLSFADFRLVPQSGAVETPKFSVLIDETKLSADSSFLKKITKRFSAECVSNAAIFDKNAEVSAAIAGRNFGAAKTAKLDWFVSPKYSEEVLAKGSAEIELPSGDFSKEFVFNAPDKNGLYVLNFSVDGEKSGCVPFAVSPRMRVAAGDLPVDLGYCGVFTNGESGCPTAEEIAYLADSGIVYLRMWDGGNPFNWRVIEPKEGVYEWTVADETVRLAAKNKLQVVPVLGGMFFVYPPEMGLRGHRQADWLYAKSEVVRTLQGFENQGRKAIKPPLEDWKRMVSAVAKRYKGKIKYYEVMNEPNIIWRDFATYYPYLESAHDVLKGVDARNRVVGFSTTGDYGGNINGFFATMLKMGAGKFCDVASFHSYSALFEDTPKSGTEVISQFKKNLVENGVNVPLWHTELYYINPMCKGGGDHANGPVFHAGYLIRRYLVDASSGVRASILLPGATLGSKNGSNCKTANFARGRYIPYASVEAPEISANERFLVSAVFAKMLYKTKYAGSRELRDGMLAYKFAGKKSKKAVATLFWLGCHLENLNLDRSNLKTKLVDPMDRKPLNLGKLPEGVGVFDVFGNALASDSNGDVVVPVSPIPVYIKADDSVLLDVFLKNLE